MVNIYSKQMQCLNSGPREGNREGFISENIGKKRLMLEFVLTKLSNTVQCGFALR